MNDKTEVLAQIGQIQSLIRISTDVLPFLDDLFCFLQDISPLMEEVKESVAESNSKIPSASENLQQVTHSTENATNEILDRLDNIMNQFDEISKGLEPEQQKLIDQSIDEATDIMNGLQFQDITSQKLDHSQRILKAVSEKFNSLYGNIGSLHKDSPIANQLINKSAESNLQTGKKENTNFEQETQDLVRKNGVSQDQIDKLFKKK
jgi:chemotaxis regulatin CheY-phosphate phosphatase CheZ